jgi:hypothetical protein
MSVEKAVGFRFAYSGGKWTATTRVSPGVDRRRFSASSMERARRRASRSTR